MASTLQVLTNEETNFLRVANLLIRLSPKAVRIMFNRELHPDVLKKVLSQNWTKLNNLKKKLIITQTQWNVLFPQGCHPNSNAFDLTLMVCLLRNLAEITIQDQLPQPSDMSEGAAVSRIKFYRNQVAHSESGTMSDTDFSSTFNEVSNAIGIICPTMKSDCHALQKADLDNSFHDMYVEFVKKEREIEELRKKQEELASQIEIMDMERRNIKLMQSKEISTWKKRIEKFYVTEAAAALIKVVGDNQCTIITGVPGCGKSSLVYYVAIHMQETEGYTIMPTWLPSELLKMVNSNLKQLFIFDDLFGKYSLNEYNINCWESETARIKMLLKNQAPKIIVTCRSYLFDFVRESISSLSFEQFDLHSGNINLSLVERKEISKLYLTDDAISQLNDKIIMMYDFFPLLCVMFKEKNIGNVDFFKNPDQFLKNEIENFKSKNDLKFIALALLVLSNNSIEKDGLHFGTKQYDIMLQDLLEELDIRIYTSKNSIILNLQNLTNLFLRETDTRFCTKHDKIFDIISHTVGKFVPSCILEHGEPTFISSRLQLESLSEQYDEYIIIIPEDLENWYFKRILKDINEGNNWEVFANIQMKFEKYRKLLIHLIEETGGNFYSSSKDHTTPLHVTAAKGYYDISKYLVEKNLDLLRLLDDKKMSPLHKASMNGHHDIAKLFLNKGAIIDQIDYDGYSPLLYSCNNGCLTVTELLLEKQANVNRCDNNSWCPLHMAASDGNTKLIKVLVQHGATVNKPMTDGMTPLHLACYHNRLFAVLYLFKCNADVNNCENSGWSPLNIACDRGFENIVEVLVLNGADVNKGCNTGQTPLFNASEKNYKSLVYLLLKHGASVNATYTNKETLMYRACVKGNEDIVNTLCDFGASTNQCDNNGYTPLHAACSNGHIHIAELLIKKSATVKEMLKTGKTNVTETLLDNFALINTSDTTGRTSLHFATEGNDTDLIQLLFSYGADVNFPMNNGITPIWLACEMGHFEAVALLLECQADINKCEGNGWSPLHIATFYNHTKIVEHVCEHISTLVNICTKSRTPLHIACEKGSVDLVKFFCRFKASVNICDETGNTPLHSACSNRHKNVVKLLIKQGATVNTCCKIGKSPLFIACHENCSEICKLLLERGAVVNIPDINGRTPLHIAAYHNNTYLIKILIEYDADVNYHMNNGITPINEACQLNHFCAVKNLLKHNADVNKCDKNGWSPLHIASYCKQKEMIAYLCEPGRAVVNLSNKKGETPLHVACKEGLMNIVKLLLQHGASLNCCDENDFSPLRLTCSVCNTNLVGQSIKRCDSIIKTPSYLACGKCTGVEELLLKHGAERVHNEYGDEKSKQFVWGKCSEDLTKLLSTHGGSYKISNENGDTSLHCPCSNDHTNEDRIIIKYGVTANTCVKDGKTPCSIEYDNTWTEIANLLLENDAEVNDSDTIGRTALHFAAGNGDKNLMKLLIDHGADVNSLMHNGITPINAACQSNHLDAIKMLLHYEADVNKSDTNGCSVLEIATYYNQTAIVAYLCNHGAAKVNLSNKNGDSPLHIACQIENECIVKFLLKNGASVHSFNVNGYTPVHLARFKRNKTITDLLEKRCRY